MPTINLEMMKQLLQEFSEKEALTTEEIGVIEQEVSDLEKRIEHCRTKLQYLSEDKEKLASIKERYTGGGIVSPARIGIKETIKEQIPRSAPAIIPESISSDPLPIKASTEKETVTTIKEQVKAPTPKEAIPEPISTKTKTQKVPLAEPKEDSEENKSEQDPSSKESGDTIKSINDALKGLFRK